MFAKCLIYKSVKEWNNLRNHIVNTGTQSLNVFKHFQQSKQNCLTCQC